MQERDDKGKFVKGNGGGPGRPPKVREERFYEITLSSVTFDDWKAIVRKAVSQAMKGDSTARKWLSDYLLGPPQQKMDLTSGGEKLEIVVRYEKADSPDAA